MAIVIVLLALIAVGYVIYHQRQQMADMAEMFALEKEELSDEYAELSLQYEGYKFSVGNDSLVALLTTEQMKVQRLMEELRTVKATNTRRITELKKRIGDAPENHAELCHTNRFAECRKRTPAQRKRTGDAAIPAGHIGGRPTNA